MLITNVAFFIGAILTSLSTTSTQFIFGRLFVGIGAGSMIAAGGMYIAEISSPKHRGAMVSLLQLFITLGILIVELIGLGTSSPIGWRIVVALTIIPSIIQLVTLPFCVRSPRWLISKGRIIEAKESLLHLRHGDIEDEFAEMLSTSKNNNNNNNSQDVHHDIEKINDQQQEQSIKDNDSAAGFPNIHTIATEEDHPLDKTGSDVNLSFIQMIRVPVFAIVTLKVVLIHGLSQLTGINAIMYYSTSIFENSFQDNAKYATIGVGVLNVLSTLLGTYLIDRLGRKVLLIVSTSGMTVFGVLEMIGLLYNIGPLQVVCVLLFVAFFAVGFGIIPYTYTTEVFPTYAVGAAQSVTLTINLLCAFIIGFIFPTLQTAIGPYVFLIFAGFSLISLIIFTFFIPETKQKSIEEIGKTLGWYDLDPADLVSKGKRKNQSKKVDEL
ncbi:unnamed protein product [Cunninghamella blakesleeana]